MPTSPTITRIARDRLGLNIAVLPPEPLPPAAPKPFFSPLDQRAQPRRSASQIGKPFWIDTVGRSNLIEIRIQLDRQGAARLRAAQPDLRLQLADLHLVDGRHPARAARHRHHLPAQPDPADPAPRPRPSTTSARAAPSPDFPPRGAREVRQATVAFHDMRERVERQIEQRTAMLAGVSHDLRTILTRFRLQLALIEDTPDAEALKKDVDDMNRMLEGYLAFARGDSGEDTVATDIDVHARASSAARRAITGHATQVSYAGDPIVKVRPQALQALHRQPRRATPAATASASSVTGSHAEGLPDGHRRRRRAGHPASRSARRCSSRSTALDDARNIDESGTGLGLSIARDIARSHGGDIRLDAEPARRPARDGDNPGVSAETRQ